MTALGEPSQSVADEPGAAFATPRTVGATPELDLFCGHYRFDEPGAGSLLFRLMPQPVQVSLDSAALALADILRGETRFDGPGTDAIVTALFDALLAMVLRSQPERRLGTPALWTAMGDESLGRAIADIVDRPGEAWTIERMAAAASMSRATFLRPFTARTGTTPAPLPTAIRMMVAADLLTRSEHSVTRVARDVACRSSSALGSGFREALGTSPKVYQEEARSRR